MLRRFVSVDYRRPSLNGTMLTACCPLCCPSCQGHVCLARPRFKCRACSGTSCGSGESEFTGLQLTPINRCGGRFPGSGHAPAPWVAPLCLAARDIRRWRECCASPCSAISPQRVRQPPGGVSVPAERRRASPHEKPAACRALSRMKAPKPQVVSTNGQMLIHPEKSHQRWVDR